MTGTKQPLGIYTFPDDTPGVTSVEIPSNRVTRAGRRAWEFAEYLDDLRPGAGDVWRWTFGRL